MYSENIDDEKGVIFPSILLLILPFLLTYFSNGFIDVIKSIIPVATFILGQRISERKEKRNRDEREENFLLTLEKNLTLIQILVVQNAENLNIEIDKILDERDPIEFAKLKSLRAKIFELFISPDCPIIFGFDPDEFSFILALDECIGFAENKLEERRKLIFEYKDVYEIIDGNLAEELAEELELEKERLARDLLCVDEELAVDYQRIEKTTQHILESIQYLNGYLLLEDIRENFKAKLKLLGNSPT